MKKCAGVLLVALLAGVSGCGAGKRVEELGKSVVDNQAETAKSILYTDSLFTGNGNSPLTDRKK